MQRNPLLNEKYFRGVGAAGSSIDAQLSRAGTLGDRDTSAGAAAPTSAMTFGGVTSATGVMLGFVLTGGWFGWMKVASEPGFDVDGRAVQIPTLPTGWLIGSMLLGLVLALVCSFRPGLARFLAIPYSLAEGVFLGIISHFYDLRTDGVALQAVVATGAVFAVMLTLYAFRVLRATPKMVKGVMAATLGIGVMYLFGFIASLFGADLRFWDSPSPLGIAVSLLVVGVAAFNLILDFDFIERGVNDRLPKHMEWFAAFGLVVTIVWLYLELLRLLSKLQRR